MIAIATHPRAFDSPPPPASAIDQIEAWLEAPGLQLIAETRHHWTNLSNLVQNAQISGPRIHDARIAAICLQHGVDELWTADRDFSAFPALKAINPCI